MKKNKIPKYLNTNDDKIEEMCNAVNTKYLDVKDRFNAIDYFSIYWQVKTILSNEICKDYEECEEFR